MDKSENIKNRTHALLKALKDRKKRTDVSADVDIPYFSMEDVHYVLLNRKNEQREQENRLKIQNKQKLIEKVLVENKNTIISTVGVADILGFDPLKKASTPTIQKGVVEAKYKKYYIKLLQLKEMLDKKMSVVPQELEFSWSLLKSEADAKKEIQDAIDRIFNKTYGICEFTGEAIAEKRLEMIPFARYSARGQEECERQIKLKKEKQANNLFADETEEAFAETYEEEE